MDPHDPQHVTGFRFHELASAFDRVRDARDWKAPIDAVIPAPARPVVEQAVLWFTRTRPTFEEVDGDDSRLKVSAAGYRFGPEEHGDDDLGTRDTP